MLVCAATPWRARCTPFGLRIASSGSTCSESFSDDEPPTTSTTGPGGVANGSDHPRFESMMTTQSIFVESAPTGGAATSTVADNDEVFISPIVQSHDLSLVFFATTLGVFQSAVIAAGDNNSDNNSVRCAPAFGVRQLLFEWDEETSCAPRDVLLFVQSNNFLNRDDGKIEEQFSDSVLVILSKDDSHVWLVRFVGRKTTTTRRDAAMQQHVEQRVVTPLGRLLPNVSGRQASLCCAALADDNNNNNNDSNNHLSSEEVVVWVTLVLGDSEGMLHVVRVVQQPAAQATAAAVLPLNRITASFRAFSSGGGAASLSSSLTKRSTRTSLSSFSLRRRPPQRQPLSLPAAEVTAVLTLPCSKDVVISGMMLIAASSDGKILVCDLHHPERFSFCVPSGLVHHHSSSSACVITNLRPLSSPDPSFRSTASSLIVCATSDGRCALFAVVDLVAAMSRTRNSSSSSRGGGAPGAVADPPALLFTASQSQLNADLDLGVVAFATGNQDEDVYVALRCLRKGNSNKDVDGRRRRQRDDDEGEPHQRNSTNELLLLQHFHRSALVSTHVYSLSQMMSNSLPHEEHSHRGVRPMWNSHSPLHIKNSGPQRSVTLRGGVVGCDDGRLCVWSTQKM